MPHIHILKLADQYWEAVRNGEKTFEICQNYEDFKVGDRVRFRRMDSDEEMGIDFIITYVLTFDDSPMGIRLGYCVFSIKRWGFEE